MYKALQNDCVTVAKTVSSRHFDQSFRRPVAPVPRVNRDWGGGTGRIWAKFWENFGSFNWKISKSRLEGGGARVHRKHLKAWFWLCYGFVLVFYSNSKDYKLYSAPKAPKRKIVFSMSQFAGNTITGMTLHIYITLHLYNFWKFWKICHIYFWFIKENHQNRL